jgi:hypothetical protein
MAFAARPLGFLVPDFHCSIVDGRTFNVLAK